MKYLSLFDDFAKVDESYNFDSDGLLEAKINSKVKVEFGFVYEVY